MNLMTRPNVPLANLSPRAQLRAGRLARRLPQLVIGLMHYSALTSIMILCGLGLNPWDVFHAGLTTRAPMSFGEITILIGALVLLLWIPLRQWPGLGTIANVFVIGVSVDAALSLIPTPTTLAPRAALLVGGVVLNGLAGGLYIGSQLGPGPRDGLMTGVARRTGWSLRLVRTGIEVTVLVVGWFLGGTVGIGTILYAVAIGPLVHFFLPICTVPLIGHQDQSEDAAATPRATTGTRE